MQQSSCLRIGLITVAAGLALGIAPLCLAQTPDPEGVYCTAHPFDSDHCVPPVPGVAPSVPIRSALPAGPNQEPMPEHSDAPVILPLDLPLQPPPLIFHWNAPELPKPKPEEPIPFPTHFSNNAPVVPSVLWVPPSSPVPGNSPEEVAARRAMILSTQLQEQEEQRQHSESIKQQHTIAAEAMDEMREFYPELEKFAKAQEKIDGENLIRATWNIERDGFCRENSSAHYIDLDGHDQTCSPTPPTTYSSLHYEDYSPTSPPATVTSPVQNAADIACQSKHPGQYVKIDGKKSMCYWGNDDRMHASR